MTSIGCVLLAWGLSGQWRGPRLAVVSAAVVAGLASAAVGAGWHSVWIAVAAAVLVGGWRCLDATARAWPWWIVATVLTFSIVVAPAAPAVDGIVGRWLDSVEFGFAQRWSGDQLLLMTGTFAIQFSVANRIVRAVLNRAGPEVLNQQEELKGGRILGPLERIFLVLFAGSGQLAVFAVIVAAKGILRFPQISSGPDPATRAEYVLVGSFASWAVALAFVPLL